MSPLTFDNITDKERLVSIEKAFEGHQIWCIERGNVNERDHRDMKRTIRWVAGILVTLFGYLLAYNHWAGG